MFSTATIHAFAVLLLGAAPSQGVQPDEDGVRDLLVRYEEAIESQDLERFRAVMPALSSDEEKRLARSFDSIRSHAVEITVVKIDVDLPEGRVVVRRRDILNGGTAGEVVTAFSQVLTLAYEESDWRIRSIER